MKSEDCLVAASTINTNPPTLQPETSNSNPSIYRFLKPGQDFLSLWPDPHQKTKKKSTCQDQCVCQNTSVLIIFDSPFLDDSPSVLTPSLALIWLGIQVIQKTSYGLVKLLGFRSCLQDIDIAPLRARIHPPALPTRAPGPWGSSVTSTLEDLLVYHVQNWIIFIKLSGKGSSTLNHLTIIWRV